MLILVGSLVGLLLLLIAAIIALTLYNRDEPGPGGDDAEPGSRTVAAQSSTDVHVRVIT